MAERKQAPNDLFWMVALWLGALLAGVTFAVVIGQIAGAGAGAGLFFGAIIFVLTGVFLAIFAGSSNLPPPNTRVAPTVPRSATSRPRSDAAPFGQQSELPQTLGGKLGQASHHGGEAVRALGAAVGQAAAELGGAVGKAASDVSTTVTRKAADVRDEVAAAPAAPDVPPAPAAPVATPVDAPAAETPPSTEIEATRPVGVAAPRQEGADDLKKIKGVGPKLEELLNSLGFYHFDQIAAWTPAEIAWVDANLEGFHGRATRDDWVGQSAVLAGGGQTEFSQRVDRGEVY